MILLKKFLLTCIVLLTLEDDLTTARSLANNKVSLCSEQQQHLLQANLLTANGVRKETLSEMCGRELMVNYNTTINTLLVRIEEMKLPNTTTQQQNQWCVFNYSSSNGDTNGSLSTVKKILSVSSGGDRVSCSSNVRVSIIRNRLLLIKVAHQNDYCIRTIIASTAVAGCTTTNPSHTPPNGHIPSLQIHKRYLKAATDPHSAAGTTSKTQDSITLLSTLLLSVGFVVVIAVGIVASLLSCCDSNGGMSKDRDSTRAQRLRDNHNTTEFDICDNVLVNNHTIISGRGSSDGSVSVMDTPSLPRSPDVINSDREGGMSLSPVQQCDRPTSLNIPVHKMGRLGSNSSNTSIGHISISSLKKVSDHTYSVIEVNPSQPDRQSTTSQQQPLPIIPPASSNSGSIPSSGAVSSIDTVTNADTSTTDTHYQQPHHQTRMEDIKGATSTPIEGQKRHNYFILDIAVDSGGITNGEDGSNSLISTPESEGHYQTISSFTKDIVTPTTPSDISPYSVVGGDGGANRIYHILEPLSSDEKYCSVCRNLIKDEPDSIYLVILPDNHPTPPQPTESSPSSSSSSSPSTHQPPPVPARGSIVVSTASDHDSTPSIVIEPPSIKPSDLPSPTHTDEPSSVSDDRKDDEQVKDSTEATTAATPLQSTAADNEPLYQVLEEKQPSIICQSCLYARESDHIYSEVEKLPDHVYDHVKLFRQDTAQSDHIYMSIQVPDPETPPTYRKRYLKEIRMGSSCDTDYASVPNTPLDEPANGGSLMPALQRVNVLEQPSQLGQLSQIIDSLKKRVDSQAAYGFPNHSTAIDDGTIHGEGNTTKKNNTSSSIHSSPSRSLGRSMSYSTTPILVEPLHHRDGTYHKLNVEDLWEFQKAHRYAPMSIIMRHKGRKGKRGKRVKSLMTRDSVMMGGEGEQMSPLEYIRRASDYEIPIPVLQLDKNIQRNSIHEDTEPSQQPLQQQPLPPVVPITVTTALIPPPQVIRSCQTISRQKALEHEFYDSLSKSTKALDTTPVQGLKGRRRSFSISEPCLSSFEENDDYDRLENIDLSLSVNKGGASTTVAPRSPSPSRFMLERAKTAPTLRPFLLYGKKDSDDYDIPMSPPS